MKSNEFITGKIKKLDEGWSQKYKSSINCSHPKGFSQRAHCAGKKKHNESVVMEMVCEDCGMCKTHGNIMEIKKGQKDSNGYTKCWPEKHAEGTKKSAVTGKQVRNCVPNESISEENKGLYYNVNKRKKAGTSRDADSPKAPTAQAWKDAAKTAKKESVAEGHGRNSYAYSQDGGANDERHEIDRAREQQTQSGTWYIRLNGKLIRDKQGNPYSFRGKAAANKAALTMQAKLFNQGKEFMLTTNPNDKEAGVTEMDKSQTPPGRNGHVSHGTYGSRDKKDPDAGKKQYTAKGITANQATTVATGILSKAFKDSQRVDPRTGKKMVQKGVAEEVNPEVTSDDYTEPSQNVRMGDFVFNARTFTGALGSPNAKGLQIRAYDPKNLKSSIGSADFIVKKDKKGNQWLESDDTEVNDEYRGKGVSTMMYAFAKSLGNDIKDSPYKSKAGSDMWKKWGSDAKHLVGEQGVAEGLTESVYSLEQAHAIFDDFEQAMADRGLTEDIFNLFTDEEIILETAAWRRSAGKSKKGGLNAKGVASYRRENPGSKLQMAVTTKPSKLKPGSKAANRRKSFCARMGGVKGPMKKPNGKPTRKALALRKWNC